ncbi:hypothetical protein CFOL_v3_14305, partial [Cephalotus follicularis]
LNTSILAYFRDARHLNFNDSLIGAIKTILCNRPIYFYSHHIHYKATNLICPKSLVNLTKGETTITRCATNNSNILIPPKIKWNDINIPDYWSLQSDTLTPKLENIENTSLHSITQTEDGTHNLDRERRLGKMSKNSLISL